MGRVKLEMKKMGDTAKRKIIYSKRKNGLLKKAHELSVLCDVDVAVITFSSSGKLTEFCREDRIEEVISRFARAKELERSKSSSENGSCVKKVLQQVTDHEQGSEAARVAAAVREHEVQTQLRTLLRKAERDRDFFEATTSLFTGAEYSNSCNSPTQFANKWEELFQLKQKVKERMRELEIQSGVQRTSFDDDMLRSISAQKSLKG